LRIIFARSILRYGFASSDARLSRWLLRTRDLCDGESLPLTQELLAQMIRVQRDLDRRPCASEGRHHSLQAGPHRNYKPGRAERKVVRMLPCRQGATRATAEAAGLTLLRRQILDRSSHPYLHVNAHMAETAQPDAAICQFSLPKMHAKLIFYLAYRA
jgi:hypothetical protein